LKASVDGGMITDHKHQPGRGGFLCGECFHSSRRLLFP
jgi:hypothetical protein